MLTLERLHPPKEGHRIEVQEDRLLVPDDPIIPFIEGDGTGPDIWKATRRILDAAVQAAYGGRRRIEWFEGVPSPVRHPEKVDMVVFRENTEDIYRGIESPAGSPEAKRVIEWLRAEFGVEVRPDSGIGVKPMSEFGTKRLVRKAIRYALDRRRRNVTLVHKGNVMKYTAVVTFQHVLTRPQDIDVIATGSLNGDCDLARLMDGAREVRTSEFATAVIERMG